VILIEDHPLFREALQRVLDATSEFRVVGAYSSAAALRATPPLEVPTLALVDLFLPDADGVHLIKELTRQFAGIRVVVLTAYVEEWNLERARLAGAAAFLSKTVEPERILMTLRAVARGQERLPSRRFVPAADSAETEQFVAHTRLFRLSAREREVARLLVAGCSNQEIAQTLYISPGTVKLHVSSIYEKLQVRDRSQAMVYLRAHQSFL
jgi:DNA-binding NarL/FixJ family response regulator